MTHPLRRLGRAAMVALADALASHRLTAPIRKAAVAAYVPDEHAAAVAEALQAMIADGMTGGHIATMLRMLAEERAAAQRMEDRVQLMWSPPSLDRVDARDTVVVVQDLFRQATESVLIATFALDEGEKATALFGDLAARMADLPDLEVRIFVNIHRKYEDETPSAELIRRFVDRLRHRVWPPGRLPEVFYDPRSLELDMQRRAVLHAKAVVVDGRWTALTSANFTEAAGERNIEAGVLLDDPRFAQRVRRQFQALVDEGAVVPLPLGGSGRR